MRAIWLLFALTSIGVIGEVGGWIKIGWMYVWTTVPFGGGGGAASRNIVTR